MSSRHTKKPAGKLRKSLCVAFAAVAGTLSLGCGLHVLAGYVPEGRQASRTDSEVCVKNTNTQGMQKNLPLLHKNFQVIAQLPLTGKPVYNEILKPANDIRTCRVSKGTLKAKTLGTYDSGANKLRIGEDTSIATFSHENFHALQDIGKVFDGLWGGELTYQDSIVGRLLLEATAEAYAFTVYKEAQKFHPDTQVIFRQAFPDMDMDGIFEKAYDAAWEKNAGTGLKNRKQKALQAGGKAIVRALLEGKSEGWTTSYSKFSTKYEPPYVSDADALYSEYMASRHALYLRTGHVSQYINLTPNILLGKNAAQKISDLTS